MSFRVTSDVPVLLAGNSEFAVATWGPALITMWRGEPTVARVLQLEHAYSQAFAVPGLSVFLQIVEASSPVPNAEVRVISARVMRNHMRRLQAAAHVIEGDTFRVQLVRTVLRGMSLSVKNDLPQTYCSDDRTATDWLAEQLEPERVARERVSLALYNAAGWVRGQVDSTKKGDSLRPSSMPPSSRRPVSPSSPPLSVAPRFSPSSSPPPLSAAPRFSPSSPPPPLSAAPRFSPSSSPPPPLSDTSPLPAARQLRVAPRR